jgi:hypothetical protein
MPDQMPPCACFSSVQVEAFFVAFASQLSSAQLIEATFHLGCNDYLAASVCGQPVNTTYTVPWSVTA